MTNDDQLSGDELEAVAESANELLAALGIPVRLTADDIDDALAEADEETLKRHGLNGWVR